MLRIKKSSWLAVCQHARQTFPEECCGVIIGEEPGGREDVRPIDNVQNALHAKDPQAYPRDASTAYFMDARQLLALLREVDEKKLVLRAFYHSHPQHEAYFSGEDRARAMFDDQPAYPGTAHLVVSVYDREVREARAFAWADDAADFKPVPLVVEE